MAEIDIVIPAHNAEETLSSCLSGLRIAVEEINARVIVVDDGSRDATAKIATDAGAMVVSQARRSGAAAARNVGAGAGEAPIIAFIDADVVVAADAVRLLLKNFRNPENSAVFGAYDTEPEAEGLVSRYRNLLHHYVHLTGPTFPKTFWSGLGAVRRDTFEEIGGFDPAQAMMEDVELGLRLHRAGYRIKKDAAIKGTHLKHWSLAGMVRTDLFHRAIPWTELMLRHGVSRELNMSPRNRIGAVGAALLIAGVVFWPLAFIGLAMFLWAHVPFFAYLSQLKGAGFAFGSVLPHLIHTWCAILGFGYVQVRSRIRQIRLMKDGFRGGGHA